MNPIFDSALKKRLLKWYFYRQSTSQHNLYFESRNKPTLTYMTDTTTKPDLYPVIIHEMTPDEYTLSVLRENNQSEESYVEVLIKEGHELYQPVRDIVGTLNIAGPSSSIEGVGESYQPGVYSSFFDRATYEKLVGESK